MAKVESGRRKKKGRLSLLELEKRSLRFHSPNPNPNSTLNPCARPPLPSHARRSTHRNPKPDPPKPSPDTELDDAADAEEEEEEKLIGRRREKELKFVLRADSTPSASVSVSGGGAAASRRKRKIPGYADRDKAKSHNSLKATDPRQGESTVCAPTTPLPDKKLLVFILDRLQEKDTYGVLSEPVDPEELPDYHEIIGHAIDFGTIRKKLSDGAYVNLEQFEKDVFLISSNAMHYNAPDTIYYRQARSIRELAKKNFENLREKGDSNEPTQETLVRRGRPLTKIMQTVSRPSDCTSSEFNNNDATLANSGDSSQLSNFDNDLSRKELAVGNSLNTNKSMRTPDSLCGTETFGWFSEQQSKNKEYLGSGLKGISINFGKKPTDADESPRNTCKQSYLSTCANELSTLTSFGGERKQLVPVRLHIKYSYARSLVRFAANLGPIGLAIAEKRIKQLLPPSRISSNYFAYHSSQLKLSPCTTQEASSHENIIQERHLYGTLEDPKVPKYENGVTISRLSVDSIGTKEPIRLNDFNSLSL